MSNVLTLLRKRSLAVLLLFLAITQALPAAAAVPAGYQFQGIADKLTPSAFKTSYDNRVLGVATALNNSDFMIGFWLTREGVFHTHSMQFGTNPQLSVRDTTDFIGLSGSDTTCRLILFIFPVCDIEMPYGTRIIRSADPLAVLGSVSAFLYTPMDSVVVPDSLPFMRYPGNFVEENAAGVLITTQLGASSQFGVITKEVLVDTVVDGKTVRVKQLESLTLNDIPWLVSINDLPEPLILAYDAADGGCLVYGEGCLPTPTPCEYDPNNGDGGNSGREESGNAWGHNKCKDGVVDGNNGGGNNGGGGSGSSGSGSSANGALLLRRLNNNTVLRYRFPTTLPLGISMGTASKVFPLAINTTRAILRGDITLGSTVYEKRLLSCVLDPAALDANADGIVDCVGGMTLVGGSTAASIRAGTVLGFNLNNAGILAGNLGYSAAGSGMPIVMDVTDTTPVAQVISNLAANAGDWEINAITDINQSGRMVGYGYKNCAATPESFYISSSTTAPASGVRFARGAFEFPAALAAGARLRITPTVSGGSGSYQFRVSVRKPADSEWRLFSDWSSSAGEYDPRSYVGDVCFRIEARDTAAPAAIQKMVVRYVVGSPAAGETTPDDNTGTGALRNAQGSFTVGQLLGGLDAGWLLLLAMAGTLRRRRA